MKRHALLFTLTLVLALCAACGWCLHQEQQQYRLNRQLIKALIRNDTKAALALVNIGADPNTRYAVPPAPTLSQLLKQLLHHMRPPANDSPTAFIITCGADWNPLGDLPDNRGAVEENLPLLQAMLAHGANVHAKIRDNQTALHTAAELDRLQTLKLLLQHGADVNARDDAGHMPLVVSDEPSIIHLLLAHGANPNVQDASGRTALHMSVLSLRANNAIPDLLTQVATYIR